MSYIYDITEALKAAPAETLAQVRELMGIVERPGPTRDALGTIRVYAASGIRYVKVSPNQWVSLDSDRDFTPAVYSDLDVAFTELAASRPLRSCVDAEGDPWQEVEPDRFIQADTASVADRKFRNNPRIGRTEEYLSGAYGPLVFE